MLIDFHTHAFPDKLAPRAIASLAHASGGLSPQTDGTVSALKAKMARDGVDISVVQSIATNPRQMTKVNDFAIEINVDPAIVAFGSVHPDAPDALEELERLKAAGLKGVKFHPEYQHFYANDEKMKPIYRKISELGLIALFHAGRLWLLTGAVWDVDRRCWRSSAASTFISTFPLATPPLRET